MLEILRRIVPPVGCRDLKRPALNLGLVIDRSSSMTGRKIEFARQAACNEPILSIRFNKFSLDMEPHCTQAG
ncbi:hypothetical protein [Trichocoleus sp. DQ-U1]|uniref:hypothetical protein n=1 Tax=Trichocoleus sp. DQ-U1 TaxID=2933926 RepID=UPI003296FEAE